MRALASHWKLPFLKIDLAKLKPQLAASKVSEPFATKHLTIPISISKRMLFVAMVNPLDVEILDTLRSVSNLKVRPVISTKSDILKAIKKCYHPSDEKENLDAFQSSISAAEEEVSVNDASAKPITVENDQYDEKHIVNAVNLLLNYAFEQRTSEIHIDPKRHYSTIRFRIDGILYDVPKKRLESSPCKRELAVKNAEKLDILARQQFLRAWKSPMISDHSFTTMSGHTLSKTLPSSMECVLSESRLLKR